MGLASDLLFDVHHTFRSFRRKPAFSALGIVTLALGLGATIGLASAIRAVLLRPLPVADEQSVQVLWGDYDWRGVEFDYLKDKTAAFDQLAAFSTDGVTLRTERGSAVLLAAVTSAELFDVLGARAALGRTFAPGEDRPGAEAVAVISWGVWQQELGADPGVIGRRIDLDGRPTTVIGVMPRGFYFPSPDHRIWKPLDLDPASGQYQGNGWLVLLGRVKPGTTEAGLTADVRSMARALGERFTYPAAWDKTKNPGVRPLRDFLVGDVRPALVLLLGAAALLLLMAAANVAALILARTTDRAHELALRAAVGAGRGRLARQIVTETLVFSVLAGLVGLLIAVGGFRALVAGLPLRNGLGSEVSLDWTAFLVAFGLAIVVGLLVSVAPVRAVLAGRMTGLSGTRGTRGSSRSTGRVHAGLVVGESAVAVLLVVGAVLFIRSVNRLFALDLGLDPRGVVAVDVVASGVDVSDSDRRRLFRDLNDRAGRLPGVRSVGLTPRLPIRDGGWQGPVAVEGRPDLDGVNAPNAMFRAVTPGYFQTMGIEIVQGRNFEPGDRVGGQRVGLVSQSFAARAWPGADPIGRRLRTRVTGDTSAITVVGVVEEIKIASITGANPFVLYVPFEQAAPPEAEVLVLQSGSDPAAVIAAVRNLVQDIDGRAAIARTSSMEQAVAAALAEPLRLRFFLTLFAGLALVLGIVGVYSVVSYSVARRQTEFGVRMALGATPSAVLRQVVGQGIGPVAGGAIAGLGAAIALGRISSRFLYGVAPTDPASLALAAVGLIGAGAVAAFVPAWRAARVSPVESLRSD